MEATWAVNTNVAMEKEVFSSSSKTIPQWALEEAGPATEKTKTSLNVLAHKAQRETHGMEFKLSIWFPKTHRYHFLVV